ncbi:MAG: redox-regulated ATPase YchF [Nitrospirae bacterium]|nr:redox-regulated ATPase YchF [Nitrospirota bacterium]
MKLFITGFSNSGKTTAFNALTEDNSLIHPMETVDPLRDVRAFETEIILGDLDFAEKRLERIELAAKKGKKQDETDKQLLIKCKNALENEISLRNVSFTDEEKKIMQAYQLLSTLPEIIALNIGEADIKTDKAVRLKKEIEDYFREKSPDVIPPVIALCGKIEMEIAQLPLEEARAFLDDLGIDEPAMHKLCRVSYEALGLISFFTVGEDEVRAWTIKNGADAQKAAGKIHSDIEKGFIRAEVISYADFTASDESMAAAKGKGLLRLEGRNYPVTDGDIINFKFNV